MLCVPDVIFLFCHVVEQEVTLVHVGIAVDGNRDRGDAASRVRENGDVNASIYCGSVCWGVLAVVKVEV